MISLVFLALACIASAATDPRLQVAITVQNPINGVSTTPSGRVFVVFARVDGSKGPQVAEYVNNTYIPYPDAEWNSYTPGADPTTHLVRTNGQRIGPDGTLWIVDTGSPGFGVPVILPEGPKFVQVNLTTNTVQRVWNLGNVTLADSLIDDVRFNPAANLAYITDAGVPAIIIMDLTTGEARRVLEGDPSTKGAPFPISGEGHILYSSATGQPQLIYADQHEVSPDGLYYYFQPCNGGLSRIETRYLNQAFHNSSLASILGQLVEPFALTPSTGGTAIDANGNIYSSDTDRLAIIKIAPNGTWTTFVQDDRLLWIDAMWIDGQNKLWMPAAQLNRGTPFHNASYVQPPLYVFTIDIGAGPSAIDHA